MAKKSVSKKMDPPLISPIVSKSATSILQNADTYDVARVAIKLVDEWGSQMHYTHNILSFETHGPIAVIGPKQVALEGGDVAVYVRSLATKTNVEARLIVHTDEGDYPIDFTVE
jgi:beta-galactosidase